MTETTPRPERPPLLTRRRLGCLLRLGGSFLIAGLLLAALLILLTPAEDRIETNWEEAPPVTAGDAAPGRVLIDVRFVRGRGGNGQFVIEPVAAGEPIRWGESDLQLGGLALHALDWDVALGSHEIGFVEPLGAPLERLAASGRVGSLQVRGVGVASPRVVDLAQAFGDLAIDLEGDWANDATVRAGCTAARCVVRAPDAAALFLPDGSEWSDTMAPRQVDDVPRPRVGFTPVRRLGNLTIGRGIAIDAGTDDR